MKIYAKRPNAHVFVDLAINLNNLIISLAREQGFIETKDCPKLSAVDNFWRL